MTRTQRGLLLLLPTVLFLLVGEVGARVFYFFRNDRDIRYLVAPIGGVKVPLVYPYGPRKTHTRMDACTGREITFTVNPHWRAADPPVDKAQGTLRVIAVGGSSTFGANNPDNATWPAFLQQELRRRYGPNVEVLNAGKAGYQTEDFIYNFSHYMVAYRPDVVVFYEAWNNTYLPIPSQVHHNVRRFNRQAWLGQISSGLYGRSMFYTYLLEKTHFIVVTSNQERTVPRTAYFESLLTQFVQLLQENGVTPVFVLQLYDVPQVPSLTAIPLEDKEAVRKFILETSAANRDTTYDDLSKFRAVQSQVMVEVVRRTGKSLGIQVVDPWPVFMQTKQNAQLFCDIVHLTDEANHLLARTIADELRIPPGAVLWRVSKTTLERRDP